MVEVNPQLPRQEQRHAPGQAREQHPRHGLGRGWPAGNGQARGGSKSRRRRRRRGRPASTGGPGGSSGGGRETACTHCRGGSTRSRTRSGPGSTRRGRQHGRVRRRGLEQFPDRSGAHGDRNSEAVHEPERAQQTRERSRDHTTLQGVDGAGEVTPCSRAPIGHCGGGSHLSISACCVKSTFYYGTHQYGRTGQAGSTYQRPRSQGVPSRPHHQAHRGELQAAGSATYHRAATRASSTSRMQARPRTAQQSRGHEHRRAAPLRGRRVEAVEAGGHPERRKKRGWCSRPCHGSKKP